MIYLNTFGHSKIRQGGARLLVCRNDGDENGEKGQRWQKKEERQKSKQTLSIGMEILRFVGVINFLPLIRIEN